MNAVQIKEIRDPSMMHIIDHCIAHVMIEGTSRQVAIKDGAMQAGKSIGEFEQLVMARVGRLLTL